MTKQEAKEFKRQQVVQKAVDDVHRCILDGSDGSIEETNYLTAKVAERLQASALSPFHHLLLAKDLEDPTRNERSDE